MYYIDFISINFVYVIVFDYLNCVINLICEKFCKKNQGYYF